MILAIIQVIIKSLGYTPGSLYKNITDPNEERRESHSRRQELRVNKIPKNIKENRSMP